MPEIATATVSPATGATLPAPTDVPVESTPLVVAKVIASKGRMSLWCDVTRLHAYLDSLGIERDTSYKRFASLPAHASGGDAVIDVRTHKVAARWLGRTAYAKDATTGNTLPGILECDLNSIYSTPPTRATLDVIAASVRDATMELIAWYQPVEISVQIVTKRGTTTTTPATSAPSAPVGG